VSQDTKDVSGATRNVSKTDRFVSIDSDPYELYIVEVKPVAHYPTNRISPRVIHPTPVTLESFQGFVDQSPVYDEEGSLDLVGQVKWVKTERRSLEYGTEETESDGYVLFKQADRSKRSKLFKAYFLDRTKGLFFSGRYEINLVTRTFTDGNPLMGIPGAKSDSPEEVIAEYVDVNDQYEHSTGTRIKVGDAMIKISRDTPKSDIEDPDKFFTISVDGGTAYEYTISNEKGIRALQSHHWEIYLQRKKQNG